jgi:hypothetical protein
MTLVDPRPFSDWIDRQEQALGSREDVVEALGWTITMTADSALRRLYRWQHENQTLNWLDVYDALTYAGAQWWEIYPDEAEEQRVGRVDRGRTYVCTEDVLIHAHAMHLDGVSVRQAARELFDECYSATPKALCTAFLGAFRARGWEIRDRSAATALSNRQRGFRPQCSHVHKMGERRDTRCERRCVGNDQFCWRHDPGRIAEAVTRLRQAVAA